MDIFAEFATDEKLEVEGAWQDLNEDSSILVARITNNKRYARALSAAVEKHDKALSAKNDAASDLSEKLLIEVLARVVLLGWKNIQFRGKELEYSEANAKLLLGVKDFRSKVMSLADNFDAYRVTFEEDLVKS